MKRIFVISFIKPAKGAKIFYYAGWQILKPIMEENTEDIYICISSNKHMFAFPVKDSGWM